MRRIVLSVCVALVAGWIATTVVLIAGRPPEGAADPVALAGEFQRALAARDERAVERLLYQPPDGTASRLRDGRRCGDAPRVRAVGDAYLELSTVDGTACGRLPVAEHDGRWYVDAWAESTR